jgi:hypothetical protein
MNQYSRSNPWGSHSPLMSLTGAALIAAASGRFSHSIVVFLFLAGIYTITLSIIHLGKPIIPERYRTALIIMIVTFISSLFYLMINLINPVSALELYLIIFLIPITFLSSELNKNSENQSPNEEIIFGIKQALILGGIIILIALVREPLGYGTLSIPFIGKTINLLPDSIKELVVLQIFAAPLGAFILTACLIALIRLFSGNHDD